MATRSFLCVSLFFAGCGASHVASSYLVPPARAGTAPQRWEYDCRHGEQGVTDMANELGKQGWEMTAAAALDASRGMLEEHPREMVWCFKRPLP